MAYVQISLGVLSFIAWLLLRKAEKRIAKKKTAAKIAKAQEAGGQSQPSKPLPPKQRMKQKKQEAVEIAAPPGKKKSKNFSSISKAVPESAPGLAPLLDMDPSFDTALFGCAAMLVIFALFLVCKPAKRKTAAAKTAALKTKPISYTKKNLLADATPTRSFQPSSAAGPKAFAPTATPLNSPEPATAVTPSLPPRPKPKPAGVAMAARLPPIAGNCSEPPIDEHQTSLRGTRFNVATL